MAEAYSAHVSVIVSTRGGGGGWLVRPARQKDAGAGEKGANVGVGAGVFQLGEKAEVVREGATAEEGPVMRPATRFYGI